MSTQRVIVVHLRQPKRSDPNESRADPFYEFGSFGCTKCHSRNLMHPRRAHELDGARFAFAQGGPLGFRLVHLSPPARVVKHRDRCELVWTPAESPFRYDAAPVLVNAAGESDFPALLANLRRVFRATWPARFSSAFRSRRTPLPATVADEIVRVFDRKRAKVSPDALAASYVDALPYSPRKPDGDRETTLAELRAKAAWKKAARTLCS
ncbi:MAG: hypothetical protein IT439_09665 [Phycisphaerales bacterium]|nr:hypothetical protein [Phycisphaerales bacterium]